MTKWESGDVTLWHGDAMEVLRSIPEDSVDVLLCDPPYSSGGTFRGDRQGKTVDKYVIGMQNVNPSFTGDNRDQRAWTYWCSLWLGLCASAAKPTAYACVFTDWRQLPSLTDATQAGGWLWRGIVPWDKTEGSRPQKGWFRAQCEYIITATRGPMKQEQERAGPCLPGYLDFDGYYRGRTPAAERLHQTSKPVDLMTVLLSFAGDGAVILDPFAGSGPIGVACVMRGLRYIGIEQSAEYFDITKARIVKAQNDAPLFKGREKQLGLL